VKGVHVLPVLSGFFLAWGAMKLLSLGPITIIWLTHEPIGSVLSWAMSLVTVTLGSAIGGFLAARQTVSEGRPCHRRGRRGAAGVARARLRALPNQQCVLAQLDDGSDYGAPDPSGNPWCSIRLANGPNKRFHLTRLGWSTMRGNRRAGEAPNVRVVGGGRLCSCTSSGIRSELRRSDEAGHN